MICLHRGHDVNKTSIHVHAASCPKMLIKCKHVVKTNDVVACGKDDVAVSQSKKYKTQVNCKHINRTNNIASGQIE